MNRSHGRHVTRLALAGAAVGFVCLASAGVAGAASLPDPLGSLASAPSTSTDPLDGALSGVTDTAAGAVGGLLGAGGATRPSPSAGLPNGLPSGLPGGLPALPAVPPIPALPRQSPGATKSGVSADASASPAGDDDTVVAADANVRDLLGACVRLTRSGVPVRTTVVVLDRNLIDELNAVGLPLDQLLVPCPAGAAAGTPAGSGGATPVASGGGTTSAAATTDDPAGIGTAGLLAFTGTNVAPTVLLAVGLLALGLAFLRKARLLAEPAMTGTGKA